MSRNLNFSCKRFCRYRPPHRCASSPLSINHFLCIFSTSMPKNRLLEKSYIFFSIWKLSDNRLHQIPIKYNAVRQCVCFLRGSLRQ
ncbi:hypothetical protein GDO81_021422 [Engystomops pustulosus]|uniref:Uncharacterized protein n=1 Tax=Engystomops pustulosus TaxID=76066 RepID=A0AAV6ZMZ4_ENGPU|nr:hypothetical protein GDO81_021422 [Engystomops pustulosus]